MAEDIKNTAYSMGELKFEFGDENAEDSDKSFTGSVKNLLVLIKDFYGADGTVVYWFNKSKQGFKILAASIDEKVGEYKERFALGNDYISTVCLTKESGIFNIETEKEKTLISHHTEGNRIKSLIAVPLLLDEEVIAVVLCESKTLNFFGTPNIYTLKVFSESISNYIKYFSLNEDFVFADGLLGSIASGAVKDDEEAFGLIKKVFDRYIVYERIYIALKSGSEFYIVKEFAADGDGTDDLNVERAVEHGSAAYLSAKNKKIGLYEPRNESNDYFRFFESDADKIGSWFCCLPVIFDDECFALVSFDTGSSIHINKNLLSRIYKFVFPVFMFIENRKYTSGTQQLTTFLDEKDFLIRLDEEIFKCRLFNENNLYCVLFCIDNIDNLKEEVGGYKAVEQLLSDFLDELWNGFSSKYRYGSFRYGLIAGVSSEDKVFLELEKLRKSLSSKIYDIKGKEINFTASFAVKRYEDLKQNRGEYLKELENLLELAQSEGGNAVKI